MNLKKTFSYNLYYIFKIFQILFLLTFPLVSASAEIKIGLRFKNNSILNESVSNFNEKDNIGNGLYSWLNLDLGSLVYVNEMCMSKSQLNMIKGSRKKVNGIYGYSNQGYIKFFKKSNNLNNTFVLGRAYIDHGYGKSAKLMVSNWSRPFDQIRWEATYKGIRAQMVGAQLDEIEGYNRYLAFHNVEFNFFKKLVFSFGESSLISGEDRGIDLEYFNPTLFWIPLTENQTHQGPANGFIYSGIK